MVNSKLNIVLEVHKKMNTYKRKDIIKPVILWVLIEITDWMWSDHERFKVIVALKYLNEWTCSSNWSFILSEGRQDENWDDFLVIIIYLLLLNVYS